MCPRRGNDPASGHPRAHQPPLGRGTSPPAWDGRLDAPGQRRRHLPSSAWTRRREVKQGKSGGSVGTTDQGKGKGRSMVSPMGTTAYGWKGEGKATGRGEGRLGQGGRGRSKGGEKLMGTTAYGGKGSKGRAANGDRPVGAASCRQEHHTMASCQNPPSPGWPLGRTWPTAKAFAFLCVDSTQRSEKGKSGGSVGTTDQGKGKGRSGVRPMGTAAYGWKGQGKGKGRGEGRLGQGGRGRSKGGEKPMGTTAYGGKGSKGRAANCDRRHAKTPPTPISFKSLGSIMCFHDMGSCSVCCPYSLTHEHQSMSLQIAVCTCTSSDFTKLKGAYRLQCSFVFYAPACTALIWACGCSIGHPEQEQGLPVLYPLTSDLSQEATPPR